MKTFEFYTGNEAIEVQASTFEMTASNVITFFALGDPVAQYPVVGTLWFVREQGKVAKAPGLAEALRAKDAK